ncbi:response regulator [Pseudomonas sp. LS44]|uniref:response regulator n=1 Tax=Pseudomonas sp. LS44 TaxID=1357074 RepID=UPI00215B6911|nr:response regulator [Pseudomonas sp. LS44]UVE18728.1 response regulator [Pseudomonas sp. LS44]
MSRVLIADEHPVTRHAMRLLLEGEGHQVVSEAHNGVEAVQQTLETRPDLLILDIDLSRLNGLDVMARLHARGLRMPILVFTSQDSEHIAGRFLQAGAAGFVSKHDDLGELRLAVSMVLRGRSYFPSQLLGSVNLPAIRTQETERVNQLSNRELSVLYFLASGYSNHEIANELTISEKTVSTYRTRLQQKLNLRTLPELIDFARRNELVVDQDHPADRGAPPGESSSDLAMLQAMIDSLPAALYVRDTGGRLLFANPAFLHLYDVELDAVLGTRAIDVDWYSAADAATLQGFYLQAVAAGQRFARDIDVRIHGRRRVLHHWGTPYRDQAGRLLGMICGSVDITNRQDLLQSVREAKEQAELGNQRKLDFLVSASQEFSTPLQAMRGMLQLVLERATLERADREALNLVAATTQGLLSLVADLQGIAQVEAGELPVAQLATRLDALAAELIEELRPEAQHKGLELLLQLDGELQQPLRTDPPRLRLALAYLLRHVLQQTDAGAVKLGVHAEAQADGAIALRLEIAGTPREQPDPLRTYSLAELSAVATDDLARAAPVSLTIARRLVEILGGELVTISPPEQGTMVSVHLQLAVLEE